MRNDNMLNIMRNNTSEIFYMKKNAVMVKISKLIISSSLKLQSLKIKFFIRLYLKRYDNQSQYL